MPVAPVPVIIVPVAPALFLARPVSAPVSVAVAVSFPVPVCLPGPDRLPLLLSAIYDPALNCTPHLCCSGVVKAEAPVGEFLQDKQ